MSALNVRIDNCIAQTNTKKKKNNLEYILQISLRCAVHMFQGLTSHQQH